MVRKRMKHPEKNQKGEKMKKMNVVVTLLVTLMLMVPVTSTFAASPKTTKAKASETLVVEKVNINTAGKEELAEVPGIGPKKAEAIQKYVKANGKFKSLDDVLNVKGIGPKLLGKMTPYVTL